MTDIYLLHVKGEDFPDVFIGDLFLGGYGLTYYTKHKSYELVPEKYLDEMIKTIKIGRKRGKIEPERISEESSDLIEDVVNSVVQEIENLEKQSHSESLNKKMGELIGLVDTQNQDSFN